MPAGGLIESATRYASPTVATSQIVPFTPQLDTDDLVLYELSAFAGGADYVTLRERARLRGISAVALVDTLAHLVDAGLVEALAPTCVARYRVTPDAKTAVMAPLDAGVQDSVRDHLGWCISLATAMATRHSADDQLSGMLKHDGVEQANLEAGLEAALGFGDHDAAARLGMALCLLWEFRRAPANAASQLRRILNGALEPATRIQLRAGLARFALREGDVDAALRELDKALALAGEVADARCRARVRCELGLARLCTGDVAGGHRLIGRSLAELDDLDAPFELGRAEWAMAVAHIAGSRRTRARLHLKRAIALQLAIGDEGGYGQSLLASAMALLLDGDRGRALEDATAAAEVFIDICDDDDLACALLVAAGALGQEHFELALEAAGTSTALSPQSVVAHRLGWSRELDVALAPARRRARGRAGELAERGAASTPAVTVRRLRDVPKAGPAPGRVEVQMLGGFEVRRDGHEVYLAPQVARLVKRLALSPEGLHVEQAIDFLWPESTLPRGRRRLRNLLARLSRAAGPVVLRRAETLRLAPDTAVDMTRFEAAATEAIGALRSKEDPQDAFRKARAANDLYAGDLLPEDRYDDFALLARERLRRLRLRLLDAAATAALAEKDIALAEFCLRLTLDSDPADEGRYVALARLLAISGRFLPAADLCARARALARELGLRVSPTIAELELELARQAEASENAGAIAAH